MKPASYPDQSDATLLLKAIPYLPLQIAAWLQGKALRPFFSEISGISPSRLRKGHSLEFRKSTTEKIISRATQWSVNKAIENGWAENEYSKFREGEPSAVSGEPRPFADLIYAFQTPDLLMLPLSISFAIEVDLMFCQLLAAQKNNDLDSFKRLLLNCDWGEGVSSSIADEVDERHARADLHLSSTWEETLKLAERCLGNILLFLVAAIDAEYSSAYFGKFEARPLLLLVTPKIGHDFDLNALDKIPKRNRIHRPYRRLFEFCHGVMFWLKHKRWPDQPVGRQDLGDVLGINDQSIGNFFDGTRKLNAKTFNVFWDRLCLEVANQEPLLSPLFLFIAANICQNIMITQHPNQKLKSVTLIDKDHYTRFWMWHRQRWAGELHKGVESWPAWLDD